MADAKEHAIGEPLWTVIALMEAHHEWYHAMRGTHNAVGYVEWILERTTCIQKELAKWIALYEPNVAIRWGASHIEEELLLLASDLYDVSAHVLTYHPGRERALPNPTPPKEMVELVQSMHKMSIDLTQHITDWRDRCPDDDAARAVVQMFYKTCLIQTVLFEAILRNPTSVRAALRESHRDIERALVQMRTTMFDANVR